MLCQSHDEFYELTCTSMLSEVIDDFDRKKHLQQSCKTRPKRKNSLHLACLKSKLSVDQVHLKLKLKLQEMVLKKKYLMNSKSMFFWIISTISLNLIPKAISNLVDIDISQKIKFCNGIISRM